MNKRDITIIKWVRKAAMYCKTVITTDEKGKQTQKQHWAMTKEELHD